MENCQVTITTIIDGNESQIIRHGEMETSVSEVKICYREENATVFLSTQNGRIEIERKGDYSLRLTLEQGKQSVGILGIGGAEGEVLTFAHQVAYSVSKNSVLMALKYDLIISGEIQEMKLRLLARFHKV